MPSQDYKITVLENGLTLVSEHLPNVRTLSLGVFAAAGSRCETEPAEHGMAHFFEHMAFKGASGLDAHDIAKSFDRMGGLFNAYTGREVTCFHCRVMDRHFSQALDLLLSIVLHPTLDADELEREKSVVLQEISMVEENPEEKLHEDFWKACFKDQGLSHAILGEPQSVSGFTRDSLARFREGHYQPGNLILSCAGAVEHGQFVSLAQTALPLARTAPGSLSQVAPGYLAPRLAIERDSEQNHLMLGFPCPGSRSPERFTHTLLNAILGGSMSSRLFQEIREKQGLAYSVYSFQNTLADCGLFQIYAGVEPDNTGRTLELICRELRQASQGKLSDEEISHSREHLLAMLFLGAESTEERMSRLARNQFLFGRYVSYEETAAELEKITPDDLRQAASAMFRPELASIGLLGPRLKKRWLEDPDL